MFFEELIKLDNNGDIDYNHILDTIKNIFSRNIDSSVLADCIYSVLISEQKEYFKDEHIQLFVPIIARISQLFQNDLITPIKENYCNILLIKKSCEIFNYLITHKPNYILFSEQFNQIDFEAEYAALVSNYFKNIIMSELKGKTDDQIRALIRDYKLNNFII